MLASVQSLGIFVTESRRRVMQRFRLALTRAKISSLKIGDYVKLHEGVSIAHDHECEDGVMRGNFKLMGLVQMIPSAFEAIRNAHYSDDDREVEDSDVDDKPAKLSRRAVGTVTV